MGYMWNITIEDYAEIIELAKAHGKKAGDSMEEELIEVMKKKGKTPICKTEQSPDEIAEKFAKDGLKVLRIKNKKENKDEEKSN